MNTIVLAGKIVTEPLETQTKGLYDFFIETERKSGTKDLVPCIVAENLINEIKENYLGKLKLYGRICTKNDNSTEKTKLIVYVFVDSTSEYEGIDENACEINGFLCKPTVCRQTPKGRLITDMLIACNRHVPKSDYIPCICWDNAALRAKEFNVADEFVIHGRFQSRIYVKKIDELMSEFRTAYEVSCSCIEIVEREERLC